MVDQVVNFVGFGRRVCTDVGVELPDEAGEIVVLEVVGEEVTGELRRPPDDEGGVVVAPGDDVIGCGVVYELVSLGQERRRHRFVGVQG